MAQGWSKVLLDLQARCDFTGNLLQLKNKYQNLQTTFRKLRQEESRTGNFEPTPKPIVWSALVNHFGGNHGTAHDSLKSQPQEITATEKDISEKIVDEDLEDTPITNRSSRRRGGTPDRQSAIRDLGAELKEGLVSIGEGLVASKKSTESDAKLEQFLSLNTQLLQENRAQTQELLKLSAVTVELLKKFVDKQ